MKTEAIRRLTIEGRSVGVKEAAADLTVLARAQTTVGDTAEGMATKTDSSAKRQLSAARSYDGVRQRVDEVYRAQVQQQKMQLTVQAAYDQGAISNAEYAKTSALVASHFNKSSASANDNAKQIGLARHELINLSRQAQDVAVSLQGGQNPLTVLVQQGSQIADVFASSHSTVGGFFRQAAGWAGSFFTAGRLAFGGVAGAITGATMALTGYLGAQKALQIQLAGAGRASGSTVGGINAIASAGASTFGLSVSEARELAGALAATGRIANENILPIVKMGHDVATVFGIDAKDATKLLAEAFSDPVRGAETLNQRLGNLDAATQTNIRNLVEQNRVYEAQRILIDRTGESLREIGDLTGMAAKGWAAVGNAISNSWDNLGNFIARAVGIRSIEDRLAAAKQELADLQNQAAQGQVRSMAAGAGDFGLGVSTADPAAIRAKTEEVERLTKAINAQSDAALRAQGAQQSFAQSAAVRNLTPEIAEMERMTNQLRVLQGLLEELGRSEAAGERLKGLSATMAQIAGAAEKAKAQIADFMTDTQRAQASSKIALDSATAFSPGARADIARRNAELQYAGNPDKAKLAQDAYNVSLKQSQVYISEGARERVLAAQQSKASAEMEIGLIGRSISQQTEMRANLQARQQLEQEAARTRTTVNEAEYQQLVKINGEQARLAQLRAERQLGADIAFDRSQIGLTDSEQAANSRVRMIYGNHVVSAQAKFYKQQLLVNDALRQSNDIGRDAFKGFAQDLLASKSATEALSGALNKVASKLMDMAADSLWSSAFGGKSGSGLFGLLGGLFGGGKELPGWGTGAFIGPTYATGGFTGAGGKYQAAGIVHRGEYVFSQDSVNRLGVGYLDRLHRAGARGYAEGGLVGVAAANGNAAGPAIVMQDNRTINIGQGASSETVQQLREEFAADRRQRAAETEAIVLKARQQRRL